jgi:hypothetical protein
MQWTTYLLDVTQVCKQMTKIPSPFFNVVSKIKILTAIEWTANCRHWLYHIGIVVGTGLPAVSLNDLAKSDPICQIK